VFLNLLITKCTTTIYSSSHRLPYCCPFHRSEHVPCSSLLFFFATMQSMYIIKKKRSSWYKVNVIGPRMRAARYGRTTLPRTSSLLFNAPVFGINRWTNLPASQSLVGKGCITTCFSLHISDTCYLVFVYRALVYASWHAFLNHQGGMLIASALLLCSELRKPSTG
jgi:hypothetical protein